MGQHLATSEEIMNSEKNTLNNMSESKRRYLDTLSLSELNSSVSTPLKSQEEEECTVRRSPVVKLKKLKIDQNNACWNVSQISFGEEIEDGKRRTRCSKDLRRVSHNKDSPYVYYTEKRKKRKIPDDPGEENLPIQSTRNSDVCLKTSPRKTEDQFNGHLDGTFQETPKVKETPKRKVKVESSGHLDGTFQGTPKVKETPKRKTKVGSSGHLDGTFQETPKLRETPKRKAKVESSGHLDGTFQETPKVKGTPKRKAKVESSGHLDGNFQETPKVKGTPKRKAKVESSGHLDETLQKNPKARETPRRKTKDKNSEHLDETPNAKETPKRRAKVHSNGHMDKQEAPTLKKAKKRSTNRLDPDPNKKTQRDTNHKKVTSKEPKIWETASKKAKVDLIGSPDLERESSSKLVSSKPVQKMNESKSKLRVIKVSYPKDDAIDPILDHKLKLKAITESSRENEDDALGFFGKYRNAPVRAEKRRGEMKGSQVFTFQDNNKSAKKTSSFTPVPSIKAKGDTSLKRNAADAYFDAQSCDIQTSDKTLSQLKTPKLSREQIDDLLSKEPLQFKDQIEMLLSDYRCKFKKWLNALKNDFNIVLYGFGSKKSLLQEFHHSQIGEEDCVVINGFFPSLNIKHVLNNITEEIFELESAFASITEHAQFICEIMDTRDDDLFLLVNNIDGPCLRNAKVQDILAMLACHPKIHLLCTIDHINAPLIWDQQKMTKFNFIWVDATTFLPYREETRYENSFMVTQSSGPLGLSSLTQVYISLNQNAKDIFLKIVKYQIENSQGDESDEGMAFTELYKKCREAFLVNSDLTLRAQLTEYIDHKLVTIKSLDGIDYLSIPLKLEILFEFLESQE